MFPVIYWYLSPLSMLIPFNKARHSNRNCNESPRSRNRFSIGNPTLGSSDSFFRQRRISETCRTFLSFFLCVETTGGWKEFFDTGEIGGKTATKRKRKKNLAFVPPYGEPDESTHARHNNSNNSRPRLGMRLDRGIAMEFPCGKREGERERERGSARTATIRIVGMGCRTPTGYRVREPSRGPRMQERTRPRPRLPLLLWPIIHWVTVRPSADQAQNCRTPRVHCAYTGCHRNTDSGR